MSIDARVCDVQYTFAAGGPGRLFLEDRPSDSGPDGCKGQTILHFDDAPEWVPLLIDKDVWGNSEVLIYGEQEIARRVSYTRIRFTADRLHGLGPRTRHEPRLLNQQEVKTMPGPISDSYDGPSDIDGQTSLAADRVYETLNGSGPSMAYPEWGHTWREAFETDASMLARFVRHLRDEAE